MTRLFLFVALLISENFALAAESPSPQPIRDWRRPSCAAEIEGTPQTKIIATVNTNKATVADVREFIRRGASGFRVNVSHVPANLIIAGVDGIREAALAEKRDDVGVLVDLPGPKIRTEIIVSKEGVAIAGKQELILFPGNSVTESEATASENKLRIPVDPKTIEELIGTDGKTGPLRVGQPVFFDDGSVETKVAWISGGKIGLTVIEAADGYKFTSRKGMNFPYTDLQVPVFEEDDKLGMLAALLSGSAHKVAFSFVRNAEDVRYGRRLLRNYFTQLRHLSDMTAEEILAETQSKGLLAEIARVIPNPTDSTDAATVEWLVNRFAKIRLFEPLVEAKIELPVAMDEIEAIILEADSIMIARGDLNIEIGSARLFEAELELIDLAHEHGKAVTVATGLMTSIIYRRVIQSHAIDASLVGYLGADAAMMSNETVQGDPIRAIDELRAHLLGGERARTRQMEKIGAQRKLSVRYHFQPAAPALTSGAGDLLDEERLFVFSNDRATLGKMAFRRGTRGVFTNSIRPDNFANQTAEMQWYREAIRARGLQPDQFPLLGGN